MSEPSTRRRPGGRSARVRRAVLDATLGLVNAHGLDGVTVSEVAERAGVHETSIYRRWRTRENLTLDALLDTANEMLPVPDTGSVREDLRRYAIALAAYLTTPLGNALDRAMAGAGDDPATAHTRSEYWNTRAALSTQMITRAIDRGELPAHVDPRLAIEMLVAPLHFKAVFTREPLDPALPARLVDLILHGLV